MPQRLALSRAARLAGVSRAQLQQKIRQAGTPTFEGSISVSELLQLYPQLNLDQDPILERVQEIKQTAQPKTRYGDGWLPEPAVLVSRLGELHHALVQTKAALNKNEQLLQTIRDRLASTADAAALAQTTQEIQQWINSALNKTKKSSDQRAQLFAQDLILKVLSATVRIQPSGHQFLVDGSESILNAALRAGLHLAYGCSSGNCGACRCRVLSGEVKRIREHDFVLSERESQEGQILACAWTAVTDIEIEAIEANRAVDLPYQEIRATVRTIESVSDQLAILYLKTPRTQTLRFMAGQSVLLTNEEGESSRYPIASCPCDGRHLEFHIERQAQNLFATSVFNRTLKSQAITIAGPEGEFALDEESPGPAIFIAFSSGFAPIKSLIEQVIAIDLVGSIHLYRIADPNPKSRLDNLCRAWKDSLDSFHLTLLDTATPTEQLSQQLFNDLPNLLDFDLYIAGPAQQTESLLNQLKQTNPLIPKLSVLITE